MTSSVINVLNKIKDLDIFEDDLYFVGGTALSYFIKHRVSEDIDIVSPKILKYNNIIPIMQDLGAKKIEDENIFSENKNFLIPKMQQVWKNENPDYPDDKKKDFHALQNLAKFIFKQQGIKYDASDDSLCAQILKIWQELVLDIAKHDFFKNYSLLQVDKHIQNIIQNLKNKLKLIKNALKLRN